MTESNTADEKGCCQAWKDGCNTALRLFLLVIGFIGMVISIATVASCEFLEYNVPTTAQGVPSLPNVTSATIGLFRYDPDGEGCRDLPSDGSPFGTRFQTARVGSLFSVVFCASAMLIVWVESLCCGCCCSRFIKSILFLAAVLFQNLTFLTFGSDFCTKVPDNQPYPCNADIGTTYSIVAMCLYLVAAFVTCCVSKPEPACKKFRETDENDACMYPNFRRRPTEGGLPSSSNEEDPSKAAFPPTADQQRLTERSQSSNMYPQQSGYYYSATESMEGQPTAPSLPTYRDVAILDGDLFFDSDDIN